MRNQEAELDRDTAALLAAMALIGIRHPAGRPRREKQGTSHDEVLDRIRFPADVSHLGTDALVDLTPIPSDLTTLYWVIGEASLPDVDSGYVIHSPVTTAKHFREYGPAPIDGESIALVFAGDGAGHLFAIGDSGQIWKSTTASWFDGFEVSASSLQEFLEQLGRRIANQT